MGRNPIKENQNPYFRARKQAAEWDARLESRERASELNPGGVDMGNVAKIVVGVLAIGGTFFILLVREFGKFIDEVSPYNWGESEVLKDEYKR